MAAAAPLPVTSSVLLLLCFTAASHEIVRGFCAKPPTMTPSSNLFSPTQPASSLSAEAEKSDLVLWQSFDFPSDKFVTFTSARYLFPRDRRFSMKLGRSYFAFYMALPGGAPPVMYWKHSVLEAKAQIIPGGEAIYARVGEGFLGMCQTEAAPVDLLPFNTFNRRIHGLRRLTLESNGNLRSYYWNGSIWIEDLRAMANRCQIATSCGSYGLCNSADSGCGCLREKGVCQPAMAGNFCDAGSNEFPHPEEEGRRSGNRRTDSAQKGGVFGGMRGLLQAELQLLGRDLPQLLGLLLSIGLPDYSGGCQREESVILQSEGVRRRLKEES